MRIYLDHSATTYVEKEVKQEMDKYYSEIFGNPSSFNDIGLDAKTALDNARKKVASILNAEPKEIIFTGGETESINLAIKGVARALKKKGKHIITTKIEHHAVLESCRYLEREGFKTTYLDVDRYGLINLNELKKAIRKDTILISVMYANNEIGTIQPIEKIGRIAKQHGIYFHTDACQVGNYLTLDVERLNVSLMTLNGSKIYGPKGVGVLYVKKGTWIDPIIHGGGQEFGLRSGTENLPGIVGFAKALEIVQRDKEGESERLTRLRDKLIKGMLKIPKTFLNGHPEKRLPNNVNVSILDVEGEAMLLFLNEYGIYAATGSACSSRSLDPSHVILATGLPYEAAHGRLRLTLGRRTTGKEVDYVLSTLQSIIKNLSQIAPVNLKVEEMKNENL